MLHFPDDASHQARAAAGARTEGRHHSLEATVEPSDHRTLKCRQEEDNRRTSNYHGREIFNLEREQASQVGNLDDGREGKKNQKTLTKKLRKVLIMIIMTILNESF